MNIANFYRFNTNNFIPGEIRLPAGQRSGKIFRVFIGNDPLCFQLAVLDIREKIAAKLSFPAFFRKIFNSFDHIAVGFRSRISDKLYYFPFSHSRKIFIGNICNFYSLRSSESVDFGDD